MHLFWQALYRLPGSRPDEKETARWFKLFYLDQTQISFSVYSESVNFENPSSFRLDAFAEDDDTRAQFALMIRPCLLPVSMSTGNRITKPGFKAYQPVVAACQLGLNQIPPSFIIHENFQSRADLTKRLTAHRVYGLFSELVIPIPCDLEFTYSSEGFDTWWSHWKAHLFHGPISVFMISIDPSYVPAQEELEEIPVPKNIEGEPFQYMPTAQFLC